ncbi:MAG: hypothetical protein BGO90_02170 [Legionella sp. 40-6]|nr:hypothetical protein [Legionella sp.]OJY42449.1 MAG: hypothetical protein BGO90_02170 [Legionella sp. 40-6]
MSRLIQAAKEGKLDLVQKYLSEDNVNERDEYGRTALHQVIMGVDDYPEVEMNTRIEIITLLVEAGIDVNIKDMYDKTPIQYVSHIDLLPILNKALHISTPHSSAKTTVITSVQNISNLNELSFFKSSSTFKIENQPKELDDFDDFIKKFAEDSQEYKEEFCSFKDLLSQKP